MEAVDISHKPEEYDEPSLVAESLPFGDYQPPDVDGWWSAVDSCQEPHELESPGMEEDQEPTFFAVEEPDDPEDPECILTMRWKSDPRGLHNLMYKNIQNRGYAFHLGPETSPADTKANRAYDLLVRSRPVLYERDFPEAAALHGTPGSSRPHIEEALAVSPSARAAVQARYADWQAGWPQKTPLAPSPQLCRRYTYRLARAAWCSADGDEDECRYDAALFQHPGSGSARAWAEKVRPKEEYVAVGETLVQRVTSHTITVVVAEKGVGEERFEVETDPSAMALWNRCAEPFVRRLSGE